MRTSSKEPTTATGPDAVAALFAGQRGLITPAQLRSAGVSLREQEVRIDRREWEVASPGVIGLCGVPADWLRPAQALTLASRRAAITAGTALRLHRVDGFTEHASLVAVARLGDKPRLPDGFALWRSRRLEDGDVMMLDGIRTTTLATALVHAAGTESPELVGRAVDDALRRVSPGWLQEVAQRWAGHGVPGSGVVSAALAERCDKRLPRSWFERLARRAMAEAGVALEHEHPVSDRRRVIAHLDLADVALKVGVECQSWAWHATPEARRQDAARKRRLRRLGWDIVELWWSDLKRMDDAVVDVLGAFDRQRRLLGS
jgi:hypothetical protein